MVPVVKLQHYTQSWSFLLRETAFFGLILLPALEFTCVTTSASRWVFRLCVVCISMRAERCSLFSFHSPCPEKWLKLTSHFIYALFHPASPLLARIYEAGKQEAGCSGFLFPPSHPCLLSCRAEWCPCPACPNLQGLLSSRPGLNAGLQDLQPPHRAGNANYQPSHGFHVQNHQDLTSTLSFSPSCGSTVSHLCCPHLRGFLLSSIPLSSILSADLTSWPPSPSPGVHQTKEVRCHLGSRYK